MQPSNSENRRSDIWKQMQKIEDELFHLFAGPGEVDIDTRLRVGRLRGERTRLASQLLLNELR
jgi:hypothetical protein